MLRVQVVLPVVRAPRVPLGLPALKEPRELLELPLQSLVPLGPLAHRDLRAFRVNQALRQLLALQVLRAQVVFRAVLAPAVPPGHRVLLVQAECPVLLVQLGPPVLPVKVYLLAEQQDKSLPRTPERTLIQGG